MSPRTLRIVRGPEGAALARVRRASPRSVDAAEDDDEEDEEDEQTDDEDEEVTGGGRAAGLGKKSPGEIDGNRVSPMKATSSSCSWKET